MPKRRKEIRRHVSKARWSTGELKTIRAAIEAKHGNGARAQSRILADLAEAKRATTDERVEWRRAAHRVAS